MLKTPFRPALHAGKKNYDHTMSRSEDIPENEVGGETAKSGRYKRDLRPPLMARVIYIRARKRGAPPEGAFHGKIKHQFYT